MRQHAGLGLAVADALAGDGRQHDRLAGPGRRDAKRVAAGGERSHAALDEEFLAGTQAHGLALTLPSSADRRNPVWPKAAWAAHKAQALPVI